MSKNLKNKQDLLDGIDYMYNKNVYNGAEDDILKAVRKLYLEDEKKIGDFIIEELSNIDSDYAEFFLEMIGRYKIQKLSKRLYELFLCLVKIVDYQDEVWVNPENKFEKTRSEKVFRICVCLVSIIEEKSETIEAFLDIAMVKKEVDFSIFHILIDYSRLNKEYSINRLSQHLCSALDELFLSHEYRILSLINKKVDYVAFLGELLKKLNSSCEPKFNLLKSKLIYYLKYGDQAPSILIPAKRQDLVLFLENEQNFK